MPTRDELIAAYKRERAHYVAHGMEDRVRQVDEELQRLHTPDAPETPAGRSGPEATQQTAAGAQGQAPAKKTAAKKTAASKPPAAPAEKPAAPPAE